LITKDLGLHPPGSGLPLSVILDGKVITHNLKIFNLTEKELLQRLQKQGINNLQEVFFASIDHTGELYWQKKEGI